MSEKTMRAACLQELGGPDKVAIEQASIPQPGPDEALVRVRAAALNRRDVFITQGLYRDVRLPAILGADGAGEIAALGSTADTSAKSGGPDAVTVGDRVVINPMLDWGEDQRVWSERANILGMPHPGTFAEYVCVPKTNVAPMPERLSFEEAAALPLAGLTAYRATFTRGQLRRGETILITGVGGGVQTFVLLFAVHAGARVIATSGSDEKLARAKALGADVTVNYRTDPQWHKTVRAHGPIDLVVDSTGGETLARAVFATRPGGRVVIYGGTTGDATLRPFSIFWHHIDIRGTSMGSPEDFAAMLTLFSHNDDVRHTQSEVRHTQSENGKLAPVIDKIYPLEQIVPAMQRMQEAQQFGKIILTI